MFSEYFCLGRGEAHLCSCRNVHKLFLSENTEENYSITFSVLEVLDTISLKMYFPPGRIDFTSFDLVRDTLLPNNTKVLEQDIVVLLLTTAYFNTRDTQNKRTYKDDQQLTLKLCVPPQDFDV